MPLALNQIGQIALAVADVDRAEAFESKASACGSSIASAISPSSIAPACGCCWKRHMTLRHQCLGTIYFRVADIALAVAELNARGVPFTSPPHLIAKMDDHDLWKAFFTDPDGRTFALMQEAPKGYAPPPSD